MPQVDVSRRHEILVGAPADVAFEVAQNFKLRSIPLIRAIFWLRAKLLGGELALRPGRELVMGGATQPWKANVAFTTTPADRFVAFAEPDRVKIVWTLEAEPLGSELTRFRHETRVLSTDDAALACRIFLIAVRTSLLHNDDV